MHGAVDQQLVKVLSIKDNHFGSVLRLFCYFYLHRWNFFIKLHTKPCILFRVFLFYDLWVSYKKMRLNFWASVSIGAVGEPSFSVFYVDIQFCVVLTRPFNTFQIGIKLKKTNYYLIAGGPATISHMSTLLYWRNYVLSRKCIFFVTVQHDSAAVVYFKI